MPLCLLSSNDRDEKKSHGIFFFLTFFINPNALNLRQKIEIPQMLFSLGSMRKTRCVQSSFICIRRPSNNVYIRMSNGVAINAAL